MLAAYDTNDPRYYLAAMRLAEKYGDNDPRLHIARLNAGIHYRWSNPPLAESILQKDIIELKNLDPDFPDLVYDYYELARAYQWQGRYIEAEPPLLRALAIREKWQDVSSDDPSTAEILVCLYFIYQQRGDRAKAADTEAKMLDSLQAIRNELTRAHILSNVEFLVSSQANGGKMLNLPQRKELLGIARELSDRAVFFFRKYNALYDLAGQLNTSAAFARYFNERKKAEAYAQESLSLCYSDFENMRDVPIGATNQLCGIICEDGRYKEAQQLQERYLSTVAQINGTRSPKYARGLNEFAAFWEREKRPDLAKPLRQREKSTVDWLKKNHIEEHRIPGVNPDQLRQ
jgi:tetratricopeptide (TPR) repeat protein